MFYELHRARKTDLRPSNGYKKGDAFDVQTSGSSFRYSHSLHRYCRNFPCYLWSLDPTLRFNSLTSISGISLACYTGAPLALFYKKCVLRHLQLYFQFGYQTGLTGARRWKLTNQEVKWEQWMAVFYVNRPMTLKHPDNSSTTGFVTKSR